MLLRGEGGRGFQDLLLGAPEELCCPVTVGKLPRLRVLQPFSDLGQVDGAAIFFLAPERILDSNYL